METGSYKKKPIDWESFKVDLFTPHLFVDGHSNGCGGNALALLTGIPPEVIHNTNKKRPEDWTDEFMIKFLKKHKFRVQAITKCDMSLNDGYFISEHITNRHVLLMSQLMLKNMASWTVSYNRLWYHNFDVASFGSLNLINCPTLTCYVVIHPSWKITY
jgi:hypothetical protein